MAGSSMSALENEGVPGTGRTDFVWGAKVGSNYKSVTVYGEVLSLGDCVRCLLKSKLGHIGKIVRLFEEEGKEMCRIRSFCSPSEFSPSVKGLDYTPEPKELFLASGEGPEVEEDMLLENIAGRCSILCTAEESFNEIPSAEQIEAADYFFRRGYDRASEEVVGLDSVEEAIGAQKVYNKKEWLVPVEKILGRSSSQISASRMDRQSPAVSGSSSHQGAATGMYPSVPDVSPAPSNDSTERKLTKGKGDSLVPEPHKVDAVEKKNELHILKTLKGKMSTAVPTEIPDERSEHVVFAIPAPSKINSQRPEISPVQGKPPIASMSKTEASQPEKKSEAVKTKAIQPEKKSESVKTKAIQPEKKSVSVKVSSSSIAPVGSKQAGTKGGAVSGLKKRKQENMPSEGARKKIVIKPIERSNASAERERPPKLQKRADEGIATGSSHGAEQKPQGQLFKRRMEDWDVYNLVPAIHSNRVLLLQNLVPGLHSDDLAEALTATLRYRCEVRIAPPVSSSYRTTTALLKLPSATLAQKVLREMESKHVTVANRPVTASLFHYRDFKAPLLKYPGHLEFAKEGRDYINEDYRDAVATSHLAQGNTIEFDYGLSWRVLDEQHEEQWRMLQEGLTRS